MTWLQLAWRNLWLSPLTSLVNSLLMTLGTASIVLLILASDRFSHAMSRDAQGIDLVVGAKGSPAQLVLSAVYHADLPTGNIPLEDARRWMSDSRIALAVPLSLGDSFRGFRIVGTNAEYFTLTGSSVATGGIMSQPRDAVIGASVAQATGLGLGDLFSGAHGFSDGGHQHDDHRYRVSGILAPTGAVTDRLILTSLESVWTLHGVDVHDHEGAEHDEHDDDHDRHDSAPHPHDDEAHGEDDDEHAHSGDSDHDLEITAVLLRYRTPLAALSLPREINTLSNLQAAAPAMEISRILQLVGLGLEGLQAFAWMLVATACLSVFAALYGSLRNRRGDLAMLRCLGATRVEVFVALLSEGLLLSVAGIVFGYLLGHLGVIGLDAWLATTRGISLGGLHWAAGETPLLFVLLGASVVSAALPALQAYRTDVATTLAERG